MTATSPSSPAQSPSQSPSQPPAQASTQVLVQAIVQAGDLGRLVDAQHVVVLEVFRDEADRPAAPRAPGAHLLAFADLVGAPAPSAGDTPLPDADQVTAVVTAAGIGPHSTVVVASHDAPTSATRVRWVLRWAGIGDVRVLDGGAATLPDGLRLPAPSSEIAEVRLGHLPTADADGVLAAARAGHLLDTRPADAFHSTEDVPGARPAGHVPGAVSLPATDLLLDGRLRPEADLRALLGEHLERAGEAPLVVQCGSGVAATVTALALEQLGHTAVLHPGSWSGWVDDPSRPIAKTPA